MFHRAQFTPQSSHSNLVLANAWMLLVIFEDSSDTKHGFFSASELSQMRTDHSVDALDTSLAVGVKVL